MLPEFTISWENLKNFLGGGPPNPPPEVVYLLYHLTTPRYSACHLDVLSLVCISPLP